MTVKEFEDNLDNVYSKIKNILIEKNKSYGFSVFQDSKEWNTLGLVTRIGDKYNRLKHLLQDYYFGGHCANGEAPDAPFGESINDTIMDLLGYSFLLSLANDN